MTELKICWHKDQCYTTKLFHYLDLLFVSVPLNNEAFSVTKFHYEKYSIFWQHFNVNKEIELKRFIWGKLFRAFFGLWSNLFWFSNQNKYYMGIGVNFRSFTKENSETTFEEINQIFFKNPTWQMLHYLVAQKEYLFIGIP